MISGVLIVIHNSTIFSAHRLLDMVLECHESVIYVIIHTEVGNTREPTNRSNRRQGCCEQ